MRAIAFAWPGITLAVLVWVWGAYALLDGIFALVASVRAAGQHERWGGLLLEGIFGILAGVVAYAYTGMTAMVLVYLIAGWAVVTGIFEIATAVRLRKLVTGEWRLALMGGAVGRGGAWRSPPGPAPAW